MTNVNKIEWLDRLIKVWESDKSERHLDLLSDIYERFCKANGLPLWSAEDNLYELRSKPMRFSVHTSDGVLVCKPIATTEERARNFARSLGYYGVLEVARID
jgi:hypothetical protein